MEHAALAAHLLAAARAAGAAVHQRGQGRAVAGVLLGHVAVQHQHAAVVAGGAPHELLGVGVVVRGDGGHQGALAELGEGHGIVQVGVGHQGAHRTEGLHVVALLVLPGIGVEQQDGAHEGALLHIGPGDVHAVGVAVHHLRGLEQLGQRALHLFALRLARQRAHAYALGARVADHGAAQALAQGDLHILDQVLRHQDAARAGAALPALQGDLTAHLLDEELVLLGAGHGVGAEHDGVEAVGLHVEGHALVDEAVVALEHAARAGAAGEGDHVLVHHMVQQVARAAHDQLQRALGQDAAGDDVLHHGLGEVAGDGGGLHHGGHAGHPVDGALLQHAPDGEVEGVDVHGHALLGHHDVVADEGALLAGADGLAVHVERHVAQGTAQAGVGEQVADAALNVHPAVGLGGAGLVADGVILVLALHQVEGQGLEHASALGEGHLPQFGSAHGAGVVEHGGEVEAGGGGGGHQFTGACINKFSQVACAGYPLAAGVVV